MRKIIRVAMLFTILFFITFPSSAKPTAVDEFHAALTEADRSYRSASFYLRTGNPGVAAMELQTLSEKWQSLSKTFNDHPPEIYINDPAWAETLGQIGHRIDAALANAVTGKIKAARGKLDPIRAALTNLRRRNGIFIFADCVEEANQAIRAINVAGRAKQTAAERVLLADRVVLGGTRLCTGQDVAEALFFADDEDF